MTKQVAELEMGEVSEPGVEPLVVGVKLPRVSTTAFKLPGNGKIY
jgi:hypothetical protein